MSSILLPSTRINQSVGLVDVDGEYRSSLKLSEVFCPSGNVFSKTLIRKYSPYISSGTINTGIGGGGRSVNFPSNQFGCSLIIANNAFDVFASTTTASILIVRQSLASNIYSSWTTSFGYNQSGSDRILAHMPGTDGYAYFDFGGSDSARRIKTTFTVAKSTDLEVWCFVAGPNKGREIWRNGIKLAGNASINGALSANTAALRLGAMPSDYCDAEHIYLFAVGISEWSDLTIKKLSSNPFRILRKKNTSIYFDVGAGTPAGAVLEGAATASAASAGALTTGIPIAGAALSVAAASGALSVGIPLAGAAASMSSATGALTAQITLSGAALAQAVSSALLSTGIVMTADAVATAAAQGTLVTAIQLLGGAQAQAGGSGSLTTSTGGLEGNAQASASAAASLSTQIRLSGAAIAQAGAAGSLGGAVDLSGAALSTASASGELTVTISLTAQALAQAIAQGSMTTSILLDADAAAQAQAGAQLSGGSAFVIPAARSARVVTGGRRPAAIQTTSRR